MKLKLFFVLCLIFMLLFASLPTINYVLAEDSEELFLHKIDPELLDLIRRDEVREVVIMLKNLDYGKLQTIKYFKGVEEVRKTLKSYSYVTQSDVKQLVLSLGGEILSNFWITNAILVKIKTNSLPIIARNSLVEKIVPNFEVTVDMYVVERNITASSEVVSWGVERIRAPEVWEMGYNGSGTRICVIDTGVDISHPALSGKLFTLDPNNPYYPGGWMAFDSAGRPYLMTPQDTHGHGTHTSGTALGGDTKNILIGVAPGATLMHVLALPYGSGTFAQTLAAIEWAADPYYIDASTGERVYTGIAPHVVSMSWGARNYYGSEFLTPIKHLLLLNIVPVAAIGNGGPGTHDNPGNIWGVFGIGATDENDDVASFSGGARIYWPYIPPDWPFNSTYPQVYLKPDFAAPGVRIVSSIPGGGYAAWSGTSMATPHVAGLVALIYQATKWDKYPVPEIPLKVYEVLVSTALDLGAPGQDTRYGWGIVDAYQAIKKAVEISKISGVRGFVYDSYDMTPVPYVDVYAYDHRGTIVSHTQTNMSGYYVLPLDPGHYTIVFKRFGYYEKWVEVDVVIYNGTIAGLVTDKTTGEPIINASVFVVEVNMSARTDTRGFYQVSIQPGRYTLRTLVEGYFNETKQVVVGEGELVLADFQLYPISSQAIAYVQVYELLSGEPLQGVEVSILELGVSRVTNSTGYVTFDRIPPGVYTLVASKEYYATRTYSIHLSPGEQFVSVDTTFLIGVMSKDREIFGDDIRQALVSQGYPSYAIELLEPLQVGRLYKAIIINYLGSDPGSGRLVDFLSSMDSKNTSLIFLDSWGTYYNFGGYLLYKYRDAVNSRGYPAPLYRTEGYSVGMMMNALEPNSSFFAGISFDEGTRFYVGVSPSSRVDFSAYQGFLQPGSGELTYLGELVQGGVLYGYSLVAWQRSSGGAQWVFMSVGGSYHWARYMESGQDLQYSLNMRRLLFNTVVWVLGITTNTTNSMADSVDESTVSAGYPRLISISAFTEVNVVLDRVPYGWVAGKVFAADTGLPIKNAEIAVMNTPVRSYTNESGTFVVWLPEGVYKVRIYAKGYYEAEETVVVSVGETSYVAESLYRRPRAAVMIDFSGQITLLLQSRGWYAQAFRNWDSLCRELNFYDVLVLAGEYLGYSDLWPDRQTFEKVLNLTYQLGVGVVFLNNYFEYRYIKEYPYGINILYYYYRNPASVGASYGDGPVYYVINQKHPIVAGYEVGERVYLVYGGDYDYAWFSKWDGDVIAYIGAETAGVRGIGIGVKVTQYGTRWALLAGLAPELWTNMDHWSDDAKEILYRAVSWVAVKPIGISVVPLNVYVGDVITIEIPPLPGTIYSVLIDNIVVLRDVIGKNETSIIKLRVPNLERGIHKVVVVSEGMYYGEAIFYVNTRLDVLTREPRAGGVLELSISGHPVNTTLFVYIDDNLLSSVRTRDVNPLRLTITIPEYFEGTHVLSVRTEDGEIIASNNIYVRESVFKREILSYYGNITSVLNQLLLSMNTLSNYTSAGLHSVSEGVNLLTNLTSSLIQSLDTYFRQMVYKVEMMPSEISSNIDQNMARLESSILDRINRVELKTSSDVSLVTSLIGVLMIINLIILLIEALTRLRRQ
ncbi:MAG: S8 family serine peptidase [Zestosphaera sp.]